MRILVLTSRYTATRDIIVEDFGRQTRLFSALKKLGHEIDFFVADYKKKENKNLRLHGLNVMIRPFGIFSFVNFIFELRNIVAKKKYDYLIASSDPLWGIISSMILYKTKTEFAYDWHDNYETYKSYSIPFFGWIDKISMKKADIVLTVSHALKEKLSRERKHDIFAVQNGVDLNLFKPMDKMKCRNSLGLPRNAKIIAYAGSIQQRQGVGLLVNVFNKLKKEMDNLKLVIAGRFVAGQEGRIDLNQDGIIHLSLNQENVAKLINAADIAVVPNKDDDFTRYCFPYKVIEYMACNTPIVATRLGDVELLLKEFKGSLCNPDDEKDMHDKIEMQLKKGKINYRKKLKNFTWDRIALKLDKILKEHLKKIVLLHRNL